MRSCLLVLCLCASVSAESYRVGPYTVSDDVVSYPLPAETHKMTAEEFYIWAVRQNALAEQECKQRAAAYRQGRTYHGTLVETTRASGSMSQSFQPGRVPNGVVGGLGSSFNSDRGIMSYNDVMSHSSKFFSDPNDNGGGPLTIINPFCPPKK
jgi:hypothetical protein